MIIKNGCILDADFQFVNGDIEFDEKILKIGEQIEGTEEIDVNGCYVFPGFVDTHIHAAMGESLMDAHGDTLKIICEFEAQMGTTSIIASVAGLQKPLMEEMVRYVAVESGHLTDRSARVMGIHLEGPFFSETYRGGFLPECIRKPSVEEIDSLCLAGKGMVRIVSLSPELEGAIPMIRYLTGKGITVALGHTAATYEEAGRAFEAGASRVTHMFNAMSPLNHREPGMVGAAMIYDGVSCELICDLFHVHPDVIKLLYKVKGSDKILLISDSEVGTGMPDGEYMDHGTKVFVKGGRTFNEDGVIYGSSITLYDAVKNLCSIGLPLNEVVKMASYNGARSVGIDDKVGSLKVGKLADMVIMDQDLNIKQVFIGGKAVR